MDDRRALKGDQAAAIPDGSVILIRRVFIVTDDREFSSELKVQLEYFGYVVTVFHTLAEFRQAMQSVLDVIVLMVAAFPEDDMGGIGVMKEIQQGRTNPVPVVFISDRDTIQTRLEAARAGSIAFMSKPVNIVTLIDKLDVLTSSRVTEPYRVLIIDDSVSITAYHAAILEHAGMKVKAINNPLNVTTALYELNPDLILIDIYMPECNGMDLAKVIRQLDAFVSIPIVFLSTESNIDKQLFAMGLGGDDFLTKPIQPDHLISSVSTRIRRSLMLRSFMVRDSLTGLLNHTAIKDSLDSEVARAKRQNKPLSFVMIDLDHFKQVNDTYGHPSGDRVLKSLSRLLRQRLRSSDLIGRYGGEEFAVVMIDADAKTAANVMDVIRNDFSQLFHVVDGKEFSVTFSCGVADVAHFPDANLMGVAADNALYKAKHAGRNQIVQADIPSSQ